MSDFQSREMNSGGGDTSRRIWLEWLECLHPRRAELWRLGARVAKLEALKPNKVLENEVQRQWERIEELQHENARLIAEKTVQRKDGVDPPLPEDVDTAQIVYDALAGSGNVRDVLVRGREGEAMSADFHTDSEREYLRSEAFRLGKRVNELEAHAALMESWNQELVASATRMLIETKTGGDNVDELDPDETIRICTKLLSLRHVPGGPSAAIKRIIVNHFTPERMVNYAEAILALRSKNLALTLANEAIRDRVASQSDERRDILDDITLDWLNDHTLSVVDFMKRCKACGIDGEGMKRAYDNGEEEEVTA